MSSFTWLDYSESDRRRMLDVIQMFRESGTLDELGIGQVRDAFADRLFPGTSTIQTHARYFLFIPWMYVALEKRSTPSNQIAARSRDYEAQLMATLARNEPGATGVIGRDAGSKLRRLPSNIYWRGLLVWGIRRFPGTQTDYHRSLNAFYEANRRIRGRYDESGEPEPLYHNWHADLPDPPPQFLQEATLRLGADEATYLRERLASSCSGTLLSWLANEGRPFEPTPFPWQHPQFGELPRLHQEELTHARNFSEVIRGAPLLYNLMLAEKWAELAPGSDLVERYRSALDEWAGNLEERSVDLTMWDWQKRFWELVDDVNPAVSYTTRAFVNTWLDLVLASGTVMRVEENPAARELIADRELRLKGGQARLFNARALELWSGESGTSQLNYRWNVTQTMVVEILQALKSEEPMVTSDAEA